jgi:hypothetical protein
MEISNGVKGILEEINKKILTKEELIFFLEEINILEGFIFKDVGVPLSEKVKGKLSEEFGSFLEKLEREKILPSSSNQQFSFFEELKENLKNIPQVRLEIAFQPSKEFLLKMREYLKELTGQDLVLDIILNPEVMAGAIIEYQGRCFDFSLAKEMGKKYGGF